MGCGQSTVHNVEIPRIKENLIEVIQKEEENIPVPQGLDKEIEDMDWIEETINSPTPKSANKFDEYRLLDQNKEVKRLWICRGFCGGKSCRHENWRKEKDNAIIGLNSNWINTHIIASQRLSQRLIIEYNLIAEFKK